MTKLETVVLAPKIAQLEGKYGQLYASKEKLYVQQAAFMVPKGSPLIASITLEYISCVYHD